MPGRRRGKLLAGIGAFVAFSAAGIGCQSSPLAGMFGHKASPLAPPITTLSANPAPQTAPPPVASSVPADTGAVSSGWIPTPREAVMPAEAGSASTWRSVQRTEVTGIVPTSAWLALPEPLENVNGQPALEVHAEPSSAEPPILQAPRPLPAASAKSNIATVVPPIHEPHGPPGVLPGSPADNVPRELKKVTLPPYVVEPPDILLVQVTRVLPEGQQIIGQHLVRPDGTMSLGHFGSIKVAGLTLDQTRDAILTLLNTSPVFDEKYLEKNQFKAHEVSVDVLAYNSKVYYIITDGAGYGEAVYRVPITGNETVLDALGQINGLPPVASKKHIWIARRTPDHPGGNNILPVDWINITQAGSTATNYQIFPGDRVYVKADKLINFDNKLSKWLSPIERIFGGTLLGATTVNAVRGQGSSGSGTGR